MNTDKVLIRSLLRNSLILCLCMMTCSVLCSCKRSASNSNAGSGSGSSSTSGSGGSSASGSGSGGSGSSNIIIDAAQSAADSLKVKRRKAAFKFMYRQIILNYVVDNILELPEDLQELETNPRVFVHSLIDLDTLYHSAEPIELGGEITKNTILISDSADLGQGDKRVILYADGHIEVATIVPKK